MTMNQGNSVAKLKLKSKREYIRLADVANAYECECTPEELCSEAAIGELTIYVDLDQAQAGIYWPEKRMKPMPQTDGKTLIEEDLNPPTKKTLRGRNSEAKICYRYTMFGLQMLLWVEDCRTMK